MAIFTWRLARETRELATDTGKAIQAEVEGTERAKDALMPVLRFKVFVYPPGNEPAIVGSKLINVLTEGQFASYVVSVENVGSGPGFLQEVTTRDEVDVSDVYTSSLRTAVIGVGETTDFPVRGNSQRSFRSDSDRVSSWSLWYTDVYGRWYRSREVVLYLRNAPDPPSQPTEASTLCRELYGPTQASMVASYGSSTEDSYVMRFEHGVMHPGILPREWYTLRAAALLTGEVMRGCAATQGQAFTILDMGFWLHERYPVFTVQVGDHPPFVIGKRRDENKDKIVLRDAKGFTEAAIYGAVPFASFGSKELDLGTWGLYDLATGMETTFEEFYNDIYTTAEATIESGIRRISLRNH